MAFGVESVSGGSSTGSSNCTVSFTVTSANLLLVGVGTGNAGGNSYPTGVTYNSVAMTAVASSDSTDSNWVSVRWYRLYSPSVGTFNVVAGGNPSLLSVHIVSFIDADIAGTPLGTPNTATASTTNPSVTVADSASGDIVVSIVASDSGPNATMSETATLIFEVENFDSDNDHNAQYQTASGANTACSWTCSATDPWANSALAVKGVGGGAAYNAVPVLEYYQSRRQTGVFH